MSDQTQPAAFLLFSDDQQQAEVFLPDQPDALALKRTGEEGAHSWVQGPYQLFPWKGYVLQYHNTALYAGGVILSAFRYPNPISAEKPRVLSILTWE